MALNTNALVTLDELKAFIGPTDVTDGKLEIYINAISETIEQITGRKIKAADYDQNYPGTDEQELLLLQYPINSVTDVEYRIEQGAFYNYDPLDYEILEEDGILFNHRTWRKLGYSNYLGTEVDLPFRYIRVQYNGGYETVPPDLQLIVYQAIDDIINIDNNNSRLLRSFAISDTKWDWGKSRSDQMFSQSQMSVILRYRRRRV